MDLFASSYHSLDLELHPIVMWGRYTLHAQIYQSAHIHLYFKYKYVAHMLWEFVFSKFGPSQVLISILIKSCTFHLTASS